MRVRLNRSHRLSALLPFGKLPLSSNLDQHRLAQISLHFRQLQRQLSENCRENDNVFREPAQLALSDAQRRTIYALSTPPGKGAVAVIRVSGPDAQEVWRQTVRTSKKRAGVPEPWKMERCRVVDPISGEMLDDGLAVFFRGPKSFTTEDVLELHIHSGRAIVSSVLVMLSRLPFCRPAEPGEFTRRAFRGGRLDLTQVEGLKDLIDAETEGQRRVALKSATGTTKARFEALRSEILKCLAITEALIDFGEGEDIEEGLCDRARQMALHLCHDIQSILLDHRRGEVIRTGIRLAIFGPPNAGKSSLLNFLAQREAAIVTPVSGTTRDILELSLDIGGLPVIVSDTAGLRKTDDLVESIGIERAKDAIKAADISLCVLSLPDIIRPSPGDHRAQLPSTMLPFVSSDTFFLLNKSDLVVPPVTADFEIGTRAWMASLHTGEGTTEFLAGLANALQTRYNISTDDSSPNPLITRARHRAHLKSARRFLEAFLDTPPEDIVLGAEELRYAAQAVGKISGVIDVEDILDSVFRDFCIGK